MATTKNYLDYAGLSKYDELLKGFVSNTYVAKETGKSLMTDAQANKLAGIDTGAQVNKIESISVKGKGDDSASPLTITNKGVTLDISAYALSSEVTTEANRAKSAESALGGRIDALFTPAVGETPASGSVVTYVNEKIADVNSAANTLASKVTANENAIKILNGNAETSGSVAKTVATEIAKVVADAPDNFDTLKEIADWIANDKTGAAKMQSDISTLKGGEDVPGSVANALKVAKNYTDAETTRAEGEEGKLAGRLTVIEGTGAGSIKQALKDAKSYTDDKIGTIPSQEGQTSTTVVAYVEAKVLAEQTRADGVEKGLATRLTNIEASIGSGEKSMNDRVTALETTVGDSTKGLVQDVTANAAAISAVDGKVDAEKTRAEDAEAALQAAIDAIQPIPLTEGKNSIASLFKAPAPQA